ncbi:MAG: ABC transporter permease, partial [Bacteroidales bacterium]|nr:ABC transporter permease [Bacteroidales bacterium]
MNTLSLAIKSFLHYLKGNLLISIGIAITTTVITGALIVGDSLDYSLKKTVHYRLGNIDYAITYGDKYFTTQLAGRINENENMDATPALLLKGVASSQGGKYRINKTQVVGINADFGKVLGTNFSYDSVKDNDVIISKNLAERLQIDVNDFILMKIKRASLVSLNAPFVSNADQWVSKRLRVIGIAHREHFGRFGLENIQSAP